MFILFIMCHKVVKVFKNEYLYLNMNKKYTIDFTDQSRSTQISYIYYIIRIVFACKDVNFKRVCVCIVWLINNLSKLSHLIIICGKKLCLHLVSRMVNFVWLYVTVAYLSILNSMRISTRNHNIYSIFSFPLCPIEEGLESAHHPFTAPHPEDESLLYTNPELVCIWLVSITDKRTFILEPLMLGWKNH